MDIRNINQKVFAELGKEKQLVEQHEIIYKLLGIVVDFINADGESLKLSKMKHFNPYCALIRSSKSGFDACQKCDKTNARSASLSHNESVYKCYAGLTEIVVPLFDHVGNYVGCMTSGQFHLKGESHVCKEAVAEIASSYKLDPVLLYELYRKTKVLSPSQIEGMIKYLKSIGRLIEEAHNKLLFLESIDAPDKVALVKQFVEENYIRKLTVPKMSKRISMSPGHFSRFIKKELGVSFMCFVNMYRISKAEEMLELTKRNISEIAFLSGFGSISQFNRMFKNIKGISPRDSRRKSPLTELRLV
ncbi:MAG: PocR ligand-binding domain-containing protein [Lentisphaerae bacterium]|nr:PocR ligand-binding domain-containing protein [Lentisphaerota bacterium]